MGRIIFSQKDKEAMLDHPTTHDVEWPNKIHKPEGGGKMLSLALSFSKLAKFKQCPRQFYTLFLTNKIPYSDSPETLWGEKVHKSHEKYLLQNIPMEKEVRQKIGTGWADMIKTKFNVLVQEKRVGVPLYGEQEWAIKANGKLGSWYDTHGVFMRGKADVGMASLKRVYQFDYKTGKAGYPKTDQLDLMALMAKAQPSMYKYELFDSTLLFLEAGVVKPHTTILDAAGYEEHMRKFLMQSLEMIDCYERDYWPEKQSALCAYCPDKECPFNRVDERLAAQ